MNITRRVAHSDSEFRSHAGGRAGMCACMGGWVHAWERGGERELRGGAGGAGGQRAISKKKDDRR